MDRLTSTRSPHHMSTDVADLYAVLDATFLGHVAFVDEGRPVVMPTAIARWGDRLLTHGSTGSRWLRRIGEGVPVCVSLAEVGGLVVARSAFESAVIYRSAMVFGAFAPVAEADKVEALDVLTDRLIPGRSAEVRPSTRRELAATMLLEMPLETWSVRLLDDMPDDPDDDVAGPAWAGQVRFGPPSRQILAAPDLRAGIEVPASVQEASGRA